MQQISHYKSSMCEKGKKSKRMKEREKESTANNNEEIIVISCNDNNNDYKTVMGETIKVKKQS